MRYPLVLVLVVFSLFGQAQSLQVILEKHFSDYGQEIWDQIQTVEVQGEWLNQEFQKFPISLKYKRPGKIRVEGKYQGKSFLQVSDGKLAWGIIPWENKNKVDYLSSTEHLILQNLFDLGSPLYPYQDSLLLVGLEQYEGELFIRLSCEDSNFKIDFYLDKENYRLTWEVIQTKYGDKQQIVKQFEKYKNYHGLLSPTSVRISCDDLERELVFKEMALGIGVSNRQFEMP